MWQVTMLDRETVGRGSWVPCKWIHILSWEGDEVITNFSLVTQGSNLMVSKPVLTRGTRKEVVGMG